MPHLAAAITGTAALLRASGLGFETIKVLDVAHLLYIAWSTWWDKSTLSVDAADAPQTTARVIRSAVLINLLNPKLTIFFFAFLPQFVPSGSPLAGGPPAADATRCEWRRSLPLHRDATARPAASS